MLLSCLPVLLLQTTPDLLATTEAEDQVEGGFLLDVVVREGAAILQLLSSKDETLLIRRDAFLVLDLGLDIVNGVRGLHIKSDGLSSEGLDKDLENGTRGKGGVSTRGSVADTRRNKE